MTILRSRGVLGNRSNEEEHKDKGKALRDKEEHKTLKEKEVEREPKDIS